MKGKKTTAKTSKTTAAVKKRKKAAVKTSKMTAVKKREKTTAKTSKTKAVKKRKTKAVKKGKRVKKAKTASDATVIREFSAPPAVIVAAEPQSSGMISEALVSKILDREQDQRRMLWHMAEEMSRLGGAIQHQHHILTDLVQHILHHPDRQLPSGAPADEPPQVASWDADAAFVSQEELRQLRDAQAQEQELVERLRRSEPEIESAATEADADAALVWQEELQQLQDALVQEQEIVDRIRRPKSKDKGAAREADADATLVPQDELRQLRDALAQEEALVERLRRSKLELERRAVAAEAELDATSPANRRSIWTRLLGRDGER